MFPTKSHLPAEDLAVELLAALHGIVLGLGEENVERVALALYRLDKVSLLLNPNTWRMVRTSSSLGHMTSQLKIKN